MNTPLFCINRIIIGAYCFLESYAFLSRVGQTENEAIVLWAGRCAESEFRVTEFIIPKQTPIRTDGGLCYVVMGEELFRINQYLYTRGLELIAQLHTHPEKAYHSDLDDAYPVITEAGGVSLVIPNFACQPANILNWAAYRLSRAGVWDELSSFAVKNLFEIEECPSCP
jgi:hypothetical protein